MTMTTKQDIINEHRAAYQAAGRKGKGSILDALEATTGLRRQAIIQRFHRLPVEQGNGKRRGRRCQYDADVTAALKEIWQAGNEICGERLHPSIPEYVRVLQRDSMWLYDAGTTAALLQMRLATVKRRVASFAKAGRRRRGHGTTKETV